VTWTTGVPQLGRLAFELAAAPWMSAAPCRRNPRPFFSDDLRAMNTKQAMLGYDYPEARKICATCPFSGPDGPCLAHALATASEFGLWGGFSPLERREIRRERERARNRVSA
jgi:hypothetical protein